MPHAPRYLWHPSQKSLLRECDPDALETGYAFNGMDKGAIAAVDKQDVGGIQRWASDNTLVPHFKFTLGVPYAPVHLSPFHRGEHLTAQSKTRHLPQLTDRDRKPASDADIEELTSFTNPDFLKQVPFPADAPHPQHNVADAQLRPNH